MERRWLIGIGFLVALTAIWLALAPLGGSNDATRITENPPSEAPPPPEPSAPATAPEKPSTEAPTEPTTVPPANNPPANPTTPSNPATPENVPAAGTKPRMLNGFPVPERMGLVDAFRSAFESDPRDQSSHATETEIESAYRDPHIPQALFKAVVCKRTVCRIELEWAPDRAQAYMGSLMTIMMGKQRTIALEPQGELDKENRVAVHVYVTPEGVPPPQPK